MTCSGVKTPDSRVATQTGSPLQIDFRAERLRCVRCSEPFGVKSTIERVIDKLAGQRWKVIE